MSKKYIIHCEDSISEEEMLGYISVVIRQGRISSTRDIPHYCHHISWENGVQLSASLTPLGTDVFRLWKE